MALFVGSAIKSERLLAVGFVGNDGFGATLAQPKAQIGAVVRSITEKLLGRSGAADEPFCGWAIVGLPACQQDAKKTAFSIRDCVYFRVTPAARAANRLLMFPLFAPEAERCALTWVASIICVSTDRPRAASSRNSRSHTPRSAQRTKRL